MFKFLLVIGLVLYVIYKIGTLFFRAGAASQQFRSNRQQGNFNNNQQQPPQQKERPKNKAGEYIDYEEVK